MEKNKIRREKGGNLSVRGSNKGVAKSPKRQKTRGNGGVAYATRRQ